MGNLHEISVFAFSTDNVRKIITGHPLITYYNNEILSIMAVKLQITPSREGLAIILPRFQARRKTIMTLDNRMDIGRLIRDHRCMGQTNGRQ